jgi:hypothetical protein
MIIRTSEQNNTERCSSSDWKSCPVAKQHQEKQPGEGVCPFLQESLVQFCSTSSVSKFVPYNDATQSQCTNEDHRYCELFVTMKKREAPEHINADQARRSTGTAISSVESFAFPGDLAFAPNHMWIDVSEHRSCHIGIDAILARVLGRIDAISFVTASGTAFPTASLNVRGIDLLMAFPNQIVLTGLNTYLRSRPLNLTASPYTLGWFFEGLEINEIAGRKPQTIDDGCIRGEQARDWMAAESRRIANYASERFTRSRQKELPTLMDGGMFIEGLVNHLTREETLQLFNEFFSPAAKRRLA